MGDRLVRLSRWLPYVWAAALLVSLVTPAVTPRSIREWQLIVLLPGFATLRKGRKAVGGTALGPVFRWAAVGLALLIGSQYFGLVEDGASGRPLAGMLVYLATLAAIASFLTVLNARSPGSGAWAILMGLLVLVFLVPWLEGGGLARATNGLGRLRLDNPWTIFYWLVVIAGVTNFLPTRHVKGASLAGVALILEYVALTHPEWSPSTRASMWQAVAWVWALAMFAGFFPSTPRPTDDSDLARLWLWFRDRWGVVWGLRILERFNRTAETMGWNFRLGWDGPVATEPDVLPVVPDAAAKVLAGLLRRFAESETLDRVLAQGAPCESAGQPGS